MLADYSFYDGALKEFNASEKKRAQSNQFYAIDKGISTFGTLFLILILRLKRWRIKSAIHMGLVLSIF
jgi:hypothetical protein